MFRLLLLLCAFAMNAKATITFTGDVASDFTDADGDFVVVVGDGDFQDVGLPPGWFSDMSGWDMQALAFSYDGVTDTLRIGIDCFAICGDADGDGDPDNSSPDLIARGGQDLPQYANSESFAVAFDIGVEGSNSDDLDDQMDFIMGFPAEQPADSERFDCSEDLDASCFGLYRFDQGNSAAQPGQRFFVRASDSVLPHPVERFQIAPGTPVVASNSDLEFAVLNFNQLREKFGVPPVDARREWSINVLAFAGSFQDDGVGEDSFPNDADFRLITIPCSLNDACDICGGDGSTCLDCAGVANGVNTYDACDVCGGDGSTCRDCNGVPNGPDQYDACDICAGDGSSCLDCNGTPGGQASYDACDVCGGDGSSCLDCAGQPNGVSSYDQCGVCGGNGTSCLDCLGQPNGSARYDVCDICAGNGLTCLDCNGTPFGSDDYDECDVCGGDGSSCCGADGRECCVNYCGVPDSYWDFILLPVTLDNLIEKFLFTRDIFAWLCDNLPPFEEVESQAAELHIGRMAEFNRLFLEECLETFCEKSTTIYSQLVFDNAVVDCEEEYIPKSHLNGPLGA